MIPEISSLVVIRITFALFMLFVASVLDLKKREIDDRLWIIFSGIAFLMIFLSNDIWNAAKTIAFSMIIAPIALLIWRFGIFGGADAFCLIVLAGLAPLSSLTGHNITPFSTLTNAVIISIIPIFVNLTRNLVALLKKQDIFRGVRISKMNKIIALFIGYRANNPKYCFSIEKIQGNHKHLSFSLKHADNVDFCTTSDTWVTPGIPYILYISCGFIIQILYGDIIFNLLNGVK